MNWLRFFPLLRILIPFILGIIFAFYYPNPPDQTLYYSVAGLFVVSSVAIYSKNIFTSWRKRWVAGLATFVLLLFIGYLLAVSNIELYQTNHLSNFEPDSTTVYLGIVDEEPQQKSNSEKTILRIKAIREQGQWKTALGRVLTYLKQDSSAGNITYGDEIIFRARPEPVPPPRNPNEFDYRRYLSHHYIYHRVFLTRESFVVGQNKPANPVKAIAIKIRNKLLKNYQNAGLTGDRYAILSALTLGKKDYLTTEMKTSYSSAGAMHVLAVSGLHVGIIFLILKYSLFFLNKKKYGRIVKALILLPAIWAYALVSGFSPSVIRAATMFTFIILALTIRKSGNIYNTIAISALIILAINPFMILEVGFQLSYLAVFGIVYLQPKIYGLFSTSNWLLDKAWAITCVSLSAQVATAPLGMLYFHQFPVWFLFSNLVVIPIAFLMMFGGVAFQLLFWVPYLSDAIVFILKLLADALNYSVAIIEKLPASLLSGIDISVLETWLIYISFAGVIMWLTQKKKRWLIVGLVSFLGLVISQTVEQRQQLLQQNLTIYSVRNYTPIQFTRGKNAWIVLDSSLLRDSDKTRFHLEHNWWQQGLTDINTISKAQYQSPYFIKNNQALVAGNIRILVIDNKVPDKNALDAFHPQIIIVENIGTYRLQKLLDYYQPEFYVTSTKTSYWIADKVKIWCTKNNIGFHNLKTEGAFVLDKSSSKNLIE